MDGMGMPRSASMTRKALDIRNANYIYILYMCAGFAVEQNLVFCTVHV